MGKGTESPGTRRRDMKTNDKKTPKKPKAPSIATVLRAWARKYEREAKRRMLLAGKTA